MIRVIVNLFGKFTFYRHTYYIFSWYVREYTSKSDCSICVYGHYRINLNLRLRNVKLRKRSVISSDSYNVIDIELECCCVSHNVVINIVYEAISLHSSI